MAKLMSFLNSDSWWDGPPREITPPSDPFLCGYLLMYGVAYLWKFCVTSVLAGKMVRTASSQETSKKGNNIQRSQMANNVVFGKSFYLVNSFWFCFCCSCWRVLGTQKKKKEFKVFKMVFDGFTSILYSLLFIYQLNDISMSTTKLYV